MAEDVYCLARTEGQAQEIIEKIKTIGVTTGAFTILRAGRSISEEARNAANGAVGGSIIGLLFGVAVLSTMGFAGIPGLFEAVLLLACAALGGTMFGAIVGSTGLFAKKRIPASLEAHFGEDIKQGGILISVHVRDVAQRDRLIGTMNDLGVADIQYSGVQAA